MIRTKDEEDRMTNEGGVQADMKKYKVTKTVTEYHVFIVEADDLRRLIE
jgi:hypothetical protein